MAEIHNNPKIKGPRMPLMLTEERAKVWLGADTGHKTMPDLLAYAIAGAAEIKLKAHTVAPLRGKAYKGNVPDAHKPFSYPALNTLF